MVSAQPTTANECDVLEQGILQIAKKSVHGDISSVLASGRTRHHPRVRQRYAVGFENLQEVVTMLTNNISAGGIFIATDRSARVNEMVEVTLYIPHLGRPIKVRSRVARCVSVEAAKQDGQTPGIGVEFTDLSSGDRRAISSLVHNLRRAIVWIGNPGDAVSRNAKFLHRENVRILSFPSIEMLLEKADVFADVDEIPLCIVTDSAFRAEGRSSKSATLRRLFGERTKIMFAGCTNEEEWASVAEEIGVAMRSHPRASCDGTVEFVAATGIRIRGSMRNISLGGMLVCCEKPLGDDVAWTIQFQLPGTSALSCDGSIAWANPSGAGAEGLVGVRFASLQPVVRAAIAGYVGN